MRVRRGAVPVLLWCLATTASIAVASLALRPVLRTAVPQDTVPVATDEERGNRDAVTQSVPALATGSPRPEPTVPSAPRPVFPPPTSAPAPRGSASAPGEQKTTATTAPARMVNGWTVTTGTDGVDVYLKSFRSDGGDAVIRIRAGVVSVVTATPRDGYSVSQAQNEPNRLAVQFVSSSGGVAYLVDCMWWQNGPHGQVTRIGS
ncbi:hypothetical protein ABT297_41915 [Dactylosporangium sp. NPDC000555]|uniref:hypothetical protein n=1 Tax=Dactylosporangium sp. NPDC000555 TaxID=3154260 RepID=UPI0033325E5B